MSYNNKLYSKKVMLVVKVSLIAHTHHVIKESYVCYLQVNNLVGLWIIYSVCDKECSSRLEIIGTYQGCSAHGTSWYLGRIDNIPGSTWMCANSSSLSSIHIFCNYSLWGKYKMCILYVLWLYLKLNLFLIYHHIQL